MRRLLAALTLVLLLTACGSTRTVTRTVTVTRTTAASPNGDLRLIGRVVSITPSSGGYLLRFDPLWFLSGVTANVAQAEDQGTPCAPLSCPPVPNDNYRVDEAHRAFTFLLPASTRGTVLVRNAQNGGPFPATSISAAALARLAAGRSALKLFEPLSSGVWITVHIDTVRSFRQQYVP